MMPRATTPQAFVGRAPWPEADPLVGLLGPSGPRADEGRPPNVWAALRDAKAKPRTDARPKTVNSFPVNKSSMKNRA